MENVTDFDRGPNARSEDPLNSGSGPRPSTKRCEPYDVACEEVHEREKACQNLDEAYRLRDAAPSREDWDFYQELVYRLRAREYLSRRFVTKRGVRRRELSRAVARRADGLPSQAEPAGLLGRMLKRVFGGRGRARNT
jgi:hypothetical protein